MPSKTLPLSYRHLLGNSRGAHPKPARHLALTAAGLVLALAASPLVANELPFESRSDLDAAFDNASSVFAADVDGDGDLDVIAAAEAEGAGLGEVSWYENTTGNATAWTKHVIEGTTVRQTRKAVGADFDGDGDIDVVAITEWFQDILVFLNADGVGTSWTQVTVDNDVPFVCNVEPVDVDGDGDLDIVGGGKRASHVLAWWENDGMATSPWTEHTIKANFTGPCSVGLGDIDKDGLIDVFAGAEFLDSVSWFKNPGAGTTWTETPVSSSMIDGVRAMHAGDYDGDGDLDAVAAAANSDDILWFENSAGDGSTWTEHVIDGDFDEAWDVLSVDFDGDGDLDIVGASRLETPPNPQGAVSWWDNAAGDGSVWNRFDVDNATSGPQGIDVADLDGDGKLDALAAGRNDRVSWWRNDSIERNVSWFEERSVDAATSGARGVALADLDCDSDLDVVASAGGGDTIEWWSNADGDGTAWSFEAQLATSFVGAWGLAVGDLDGDGDIDAAGAAETDGDISWFDNTVGDGSAWTETVIDSGATGARSVVIGDVDGDGDLDIAAAAVDADEFAWYENTLGDASAWSKTSISTVLATTHDGAATLTLADIDGDGDLDVVGGSSLDDEVLFFENTAGDGSAWAEVVIGAAVGAPSGVAVADIDQDGDLDVVATAETGDDVVWFANTAGDGSAWSAAQFVAENAVDGPSALGISDFDGDGDLDIAVTASLSGGSAVWFANTSGDGSTWGGAQSVVGSFDGAAALALGDVDSNGLVDLVAAAETDGDVSFLPNLGGQFGLDTTDTAPGSLGNTVTDDLFLITARHNGVASDQDIELATFELLLEETAGDPLTTAEAMAIIENLFVFLDDGSGMWESGSDTLVATVPRASLSLTDGVQAIGFADSDVNVQIQSGTPRTYFAVVQTTANYSSRGLFSVRFSHVTESSSSAEDRVYDVPLRLEYAPNTVGPTLDVNPGGTPQADLLIESITDSPDPVSPGANVTYTVTVRNDGEWKAENVRVASTVPTGTTFASTSGCAEDPAGSATCTLGDVSLFDTASFTYTVTVDPGTMGTVTYEGTVSSDTNEAAPGDETDSETTEVQGEGDVRLELGAGPGTYTAGGTLTFALEVTNDGPGDDPSALVTDTFPASFQSVTWTCEASGGASCASPSGSGNISESVNIPSGGKVIFWAKGTVQAGLTTPISNTATVTGSDDSNNANDSDTLEIVEGALLFGDGFESGDTGGWSTSVP